MKYTFKRWFAGLLSVVMVLTLLPVSALEGEGQSSDSPYVIGNDTGQDPVPIDSDGTLEDGGFTCVVDGSTLTITGSGELNASDLPSNKDGIQTVIIKGAVTSIGNNCFDGWTNLQSITLPETLQTIGEDAFHGCSALALTELPAGVTSIGTRAFGDCVSLALKELPAGLKAIESQTFSYCESIKLTEIPDGVTYIDDFAFDHCKDITDLTLPASLQLIDNYAFNSCTGLTQLTLPAGLSSMGFCVFESSGISSLTFLGEVAPTIHPNAFEGANELTEILYPQGASGYDSTGWPQDNIVKEGYKVTVEQSNNGTASASSALAPTDTKITLTAVPAEGYHLDRWETDSNVQIDKSDNSFTMPDHEVTVTPVFGEHTFNNGVCSVCGKLIFEGLGTDESPYLISDPNTLKAFQEYINNDEKHGAGEYFELTNDIDLCDELWTPIGTENQKFQGIFDGNNYTISGLNINSNSENQGLFGCIGGSSIVKNLTVEGSVTGSENVGGIVGSMKDSASVENCSNTGTVNGNISIGGIVGYSEITGTISNCYNTGKVTGTVRNVGGIVGHLFGGTVKNCYNVGEIKGRNCSNVGGVVGSNSRNTTVEFCYNYGAVEIRSGGPVVGTSSGACLNCFYLDTTSVGSARGAISKSAAEFKFLASFMSSPNNADVWTDSVNGRPVLISNQEADIIGTAESPYLISDLDTLKAFRDYINDAPIPNDKNHYKLTSDINLSSEASWTPIGSGHLMYSGTFDGCGYRIYGLNINSSDEEAGLFGVSVGTIRNLTVEADVTGTSYVSGIVCKNHGMIIGCTSIGSITVNTSDVNEIVAGGIAGENMGIIEACSSNMEINVAATDVQQAMCGVGGIVGSVMYMDYPSDMGTQILPEIKDCVFSSEIVVSVDGSSNSNIIAGISGIVGINMAMVRQFGACDIAR